MLKSGASIELFKVDSNFSLFNHILKNRVAQKLIKESQDVLSQSLAVIINFFRHQLLFFFYPHFVPEIPSYLKAFHHSSHIHIQYRNLSIARGKRVSCETFHYVSRRIQRIIVYLPSFFPRPIHLSTRSLPCRQTFLFSRRL